MVALAMLVRWTLEGLEELSFVCVTSAVAVPCASSAEKWLCPAAGLSCQTWASGVEMKSWAFRGSHFHPSGLSAPPVVPLSHLLLARRAGGTAARLPTLSEAVQLHLLSVSTSRAAGAQEANCSSCGKHFKTCSADPNTMQFCI